MITRLHHIAIIISSEEALRFYTLLGFTETYRKDRKYDTAVLMEGYGVGLTIFIDPTYPERGVPEPMGLRHFALSISEISTLEQEMNEIRSRFESAGMEIEFGPIMNDWTGRRFCMTHDFDGLAIELRE